MGRKKNEDKKQFCVVCDRQYWWRKNRRSKTCCFECSRILCGWQANVSKYKGSPEYYIKYFNRILKRASYILKRIEDDKNDTSKGETKH